MQQELMPELEPKWVSHMQLVTFRATATKIVDGYPEDKGGKRCKSVARSTVVCDRNAYNQGVRDSKKIDVHGKRKKE
jgi:hypothetical protein